MSARDRILQRIRDAVASREAADHPGPFGGWRPDSPGDSARDDHVGAFVRTFTAVGGEVVRVDGWEGAGRWLADLASELPGVTVGRGVPESVVPPLPHVSPHDAPLAISSSRGAVAETGSIILESSDGRRSQLLAPTHAVLVATDAIHATLAEALSAIRPDLPSAVGLHSGPSKSADIGQVMVRGVHGPGRIIAVLVDGGGPSS